ncbi:MAG: SGNH/GDSL hydrolase family protein [Gammaproteobacteria bacterium]
MRHTKFALALLAAATLAACGGGESTGGDQSLKQKYTQQVSFGDSLSDVGSYNVGAVTQLGGGKFTINGDSTSKDPALTGKIWLELMAAQFGLPAPCAAQTGLQGDATKGLNVPVVFNNNCYAYAMGGSRVTNPVGPNSAAAGGTLGALTVPVSTQIANHLAKSGGKFSGTEIVFVMAGGNDALALLGALQAGATAAGQKAGAAEGAKVGAQTFVTTLATLLGAGATNPAAATQAIAVAMGAEAQRSGSTNETIVGVGVATAAAQAGNQAIAQPVVYGPLVVQAQATAKTAGEKAGAAAGQKAGAEYAAANGPALIPQMATAGTQLADLVKNQIVAKGATHVVVNNLPDLGNSPAAKAKDPTTQQLILAMVDAFNNALKAGVSNDAKIMYIDLWAISHDQITNPAPYGLTNTSTPACGTNVLGGSSLVCNASNLAAGDVSHYMFADDVHATPFENLLIARYVSEQMVVRGWL